VGKKRKGPEEELKKYIVAVDFSKIEGMKLYGAGITDSRHVDILVGMLEDFPYVGKLRSTQKRAIVNSFSVKFKKYEKYVDLYVSRDRIDVVDFIERRLGKESAIIVADPRVYADIRARFARNPAIKVIKEDKNKMKHILGEYLSKAFFALLNVVDTFIRWASRLFTQGKAGKHVKITKGRVERR